MEVGVFTGLFSTVLLEVAEARKIYFVDPWWKAFGEFYPDWGRYTDRGRLSTRIAYQAARTRIEEHATDTDFEIIVDLVQALADKMPDHHLDWAYHDASHNYRDASSELAVLRRKVRTGGFIAGDDWYEDDRNAHAGLANAVKKFIERGELKMIGTFPPYQWITQVCD